MGARVGERESENVCVCVKGLKSCFKENVSTAEGSLCCALAAAFVVSFAFAVVVVIIIARSRM